MKPILRNCLQSVFLLIVFLISISGCCLKHNLDLVKLAEDLCIEEGKEYEIEEVPEKQLHTYLRNNNQDTDDTFGTVIKNEQDDIYQVWISNETKTCIYNAVLIHELIHVRQFILGGKHLYKGILHDPGFNNNIRKNIKTVMEFDAWDTARDLAGNDLAGNYELDKMDKIHIKEQYNAYRDDVTKNGNYLRPYSVDIQDFECEDSP